MKKLLTVSLLILFAAGVSFATAGGEKTLIGMAMPETHVDRWLKDGRDLKAQAEKRGYAALVQWADANQLIQNGQIESFVLQGAKAIIVGNINDGVAPVVARAKAEGVQVIAYDRIIQNSDAYDYYITFNNFKVGEFQGQAIVDGLSLSTATTAAPKYITLFAGSPTDGNAFFFFDGAYSKLKPFIDSGVLRVIGPHPNTSADRANFQRIATENWMPNIAKTRMENLLTGDARSVTLDAVLAPNDTLGMAIIEALKADAKYRSKLPVVTGQDAQFASMLSIKNGEQYMTVFKDTAKLAEAAVLLADQLIKGQRVNIPGSVIAADIGLASIGNTGRKTVTAILLDPILVTKNSNFLAPVNAAGWFAAAEAAQLR